MDEAMMKDRAKRLAGPPPPGVEGPPPTAGGDAPPPAGGDDQVRQQRAQQLVADLPQAKEPLTPECVNGFKDAVNGAAKALFAKDPPQLTSDIQAPVPSIPPAHYVAGKVFEAAAKVGPLKGKMEPFSMHEAAMTNQGLDDAAAKIKAAAGGGGAAEPAPPPKASRLAGPAPGAPPPQ